jgi:hypothetical protein
LTAGHSITLTGFATEALSGAGELGIFDNVRNRAEIKNLSNGAKITYTF